MKKILLFCCLIQQYLIAPAQPTVTWTRSYPDSVDGATIRDAIKDYANNIIVAASRPNSSNISNTDPIFIKYNPSGNLILNWIHADSMTDEIPTQILSDSLNQLYILTLAFGTSQDTVHLIKVDGTTGQEIFNLQLGTGIYAGVAAIHQQYLYVALGFPNLQLFKYDLQGNLIWSMPITSFQQVYKFHFFNNDVYLIGDTITSGTDWIQMIQKFDSSGIFQWMTFTQILNPYYTDSEIDSSGTIWITGSNSNNYGYLSSVDISGAEWDTIIGSSTLFLAPDKIAINNQGEIFWTYIKSTVSGTFCEVVRKDNIATNPFASIDSAASGSVGFNIAFGVDVNCLTDGSVMVANTRRISFTLRDYEISKFDANGNLSWNIIYTHSPNSIEKVFRLFADSAFAYLVGEKKDSVTGSAQVNVLRIDYPTGINELNLSDNDFKIYPNPLLNNQINFNKYLSDVSISFYDCFGRLVQKNERYSGSKLLLPQNLKSGIYFIEIVIEKILIRKKILIN